MRSVAPSCSIVQSGRAVVMRGWVTTRPPKLLDAHRPDAQPRRLDAHAHPRLPPRPLSPTPERSAEPRVA